jgi:protocatechuate 3,4-dioxygenase beta subunit
MTTNSKNPFYDYTEQTLTNVGTIPDFDSKEEKLKITGTIYLSDGITPAKDVILYIEQPNEKGSYEMVKENSKRYVHHRTWIKTNEDGQYTFYTFIPGKRLSSRKLKHIHPVVKEPKKEAYNLPAYLFDEDPKLSNLCRKRLEKQGVTGIIELEKKENIFIAKRDIVLSQTETVL